MRRLGSFVGAVVLLAVLIAGCGGGGGGGGESTAAASVETTESLALSKEELLAQGDAICAEVNAAIGSAGSTSADAGSEVIQVAGLYEGMVERLKGLGPPSDEGAGYPEFITSAEALAQAEDNVKLAYEREESEALAESSTEVATALSGFESAAGEFGFESCAEAPAAPTPGGSSEESAGEESPGGVEGEAEAAPEEEAEAAPEEAPPVEEESPGGGAGVGGGSEGGSGSGGSSGGIGPG